MGVAIFILDFITEQLTVAEIMILGGSKKSVSPSFDGMQNDISMKR